MSGLLGATAEMARTENVAPPARLLRLQRNLITQVGAVIPLSGSHNNRLERLRREADTRLGTLFTLKQAAQGGINEIPEV